MSVMHAVADPLAVFKSENSFMVACPYMHIGIVPRLFHHTDENQSPKASNLVVTSPFRPMYIALHLCVYIIV